MKFNWIKCKYTFESKYKGNTDLQHVCVALVVFMGRLSFLSSKQQ